MKIHTDKPWVAWALLPLPLLGAVVLLVLQLHTNSTLNTSIEKQEEIAYTLAVSNRTACERSVQGRSHLINIFEALHEGTSVEPETLAWVTNVTNGLSEHPNSSNPQKVNLVNCDKHFPVPPKP